jgi:hypothetical protein
MVAVLRGPKYVGCHFESLHVSLGMRSIAVKLYVTLVLKYVIRNGCRSHFLGFMKRINYICLQSRFSHRFLWNLSVF